MHSAAFDELCCYSLVRGDPAFIHQHVVDAFAAQHVSPDDKPIKLAFALVGLYLHIEKGFTGREVQLAHMKLGRTKQEWPTFKIPDDRGPINVATVLAAPTEQRDSMIHDWCRVVWNSFEDQGEKVRQLLESNSISEAWSVRR